MALNSESPYIGDQAAKDMADLIGPNALDVLPAAERTVVPVAE